MATHELLRPVDGRFGTRDERLALQVVAHIVGELGRAAVALGAVLAHGLHRQPFQFAPQRLHQRVGLHAAALGDLGGAVLAASGLHLGELAQLGAGSRRIGVADDAVDLGQTSTAQGLGIEGRRTGEQLIQHDAERVHVGARVDVVGAIGLLGAHVLRRADHLAGLREHVVRHRTGAGGLGHTEVDHLHARAGGATCGGVFGHAGQDVARLQVAVDDALHVRMLDGVAHLREKFQALLDAVLVAVAEVGDGLALHQLHHEVVASIVGDAAVDHLGDVGMIHHRQRLAFQLEARQHALAVHARSQDLQRHLLDEWFAALGLPHHAEAAGAQLLDQRVVAQLVAGTVTDRWRGRAQRIRGGLAGAALHAGS